MKISRVEIEGFGPFAKPRSISFSEKGINIIYGGNESGKSTLVEAVYATVFGFEKKEKEDNFESWFPSQQFTGLVEFGLAQGTVTFFRDFSSNRVTVTKTENGKSKELFSGDASPRSRSEERRAYADVLRQFFGFSDGTLARRTSIVGQLDIETEITPELRGLISGAGPTDYNGAIEVLKTRFEELTVENPWGRVARRKMRAIEETRDKLKKTQDQLQQAEGFFASSASLGKESGELQKKIKELREKSVEKKEFLRKMGRLVELQDNVRGKKKLLRSEQSAKEDYERVRKTCEGARDKLCKDHSLFANLKTEISSALSGAAAIDEEIGRVEKELSDRETRLKPGPKPVPGRIAAAVLLGILTVSLVIGALTGRLGVATAIGISIVVVAAVVLFLVSHSRRRNLSGARELEESRNKLTDLREDGVRRKAEVYRLFPNDETRARVEAMGIRELLGQYGRFSEARKTVEDFERQLLEQQVRAKGEGYAAALEDAAVAESKLEQFLRDNQELLSLKDEPEKAASQAIQAKTEIDGVDKKLGELEQELTETRIEHARVSATSIGPPETYQEETERLQESLSRLSLRRDALKLAVRVLEECVAEYQGDSMERIARRIYEVFDTIARGRYKSVRLSLGLKPLLETASEKEIDTGCVSTGARDQLYFSMRIAMIEELSGEKGFPLILDDPFVNFDDERLERTRTLLAGLVEKRDVQVIVFTHGDRHLTWDANVIRLA